MIRNKVREFRKARGLTLEKLEELSGVSLSHISRIERHEKGWSLESLPKIAEALGVNVGDLLDASDAWQDVEMIGTVGQAVWTRFRSAGKSKPTVRLPAAIGDVVAVAVSGSVLYPRYTEGDVIALLEESVDPSACLNREALVGVDTGYYALKFVQPGSGPGRYTLISHSEPPIIDRQIITCRPVVFIARA